MIVKDKYKLDNWNYKKTHTDTRKCDNVNKYDGNSKIIFLKQVKENYNQYHSCFIDGKINITKLNNIKYTQNLVEYFLNTNAECKLFFDIDKIKINITDLKLLLNELFDCIDELCDKKLNRKKYLVFYKKLVDKDFNELSYTHSIRIIHFQYKISYIDAKKLIVLLKENYKSELIIGLDEKVYYHTAQMFLPYNSKPYSIKYNDKLFDKKFKAEDSVNHFFIYYDFNDIKFNIKNFIKEYCISIVDDCLLLQIDKEPIGKIDVLKTTDYTNRKPYYLEQNKYTLIDTIKEYINEDFYRKMYSKIWCKFVYYFKCLDIDEDDIYDFLKYSAEIHNEYDYESNVEWFDKRLTEIDRTKDYDYVYKIITDDLNKLQEEYYFYVNRKDENFKLIAEWVVKNTNLNYDFVSEKIAKYKSIDITKIEFIKITDDICYNYKTGNLHIKNERFCKNYFLEQHKEHYKSNNYDDYDMVIDDINDEEFKQVIEDFKDGYIENLVVEMDWGGGKSKIIEKPIIEHFCNNKNNKYTNDILERINKDISLNYMYGVIQQEEEHLRHLNNINRIIAFSPNNSLNKKEYQELKQISNNCFVNHITIKELADKINKLYKKLEDCVGFDNNNRDDLQKQVSILNNEKRIYTHRTNVMSSLESANRIEISENSNDIGLVINDEFNSLFTKFNENMETFKHISHEVAFNKFIEISKKAKQRLILDADVEKHKLDFYCKVCGIKDIYKVRINGNIFNNPKIAEDGKDDKYKIYNCESRKHLTEEVIKNIDKKLVISTTSSNHGYYMFKLLISNMYDKELNLIEKFKDDVVGYIFGDGLYIYDCKNPKNSIIDKKIEKLECDSFNVDNDKECIYKSILDEYEVDKKQTTNIKKYKDEFLDKCEEQIIKKYKITKYIRSPTISVGISINERYFDLQFNYALNGSVGCLEALQMWFRERRTHLREIYFCFGNYFKDYNKCLNNADNIIKRYKNNYRVANTELKKLLHNNTNIEFESDFYKWKLINEIDNENYKINFTQIFMELLHKHSFTYEDNIFILNSKYDKLDLIDETKNDKNSVDLHNLLNTDILTLTKTEYELLNTKKEDNLLSNQEYLIHRKYNLFNHHLYYDAIIINKIYNEERNKLISKLEDNIKTYDDDDEEEYKKYLKDKKLLQILNDNELWNNIINYNNEVIKNDIENETHYKKYKLYDFKSDFKTKYFRLKNLINFKIDDDDDDNEVDKKKDIEPLEYTSTNKLIFWVLKFLDIDILRDFDKDILKHYIVDNTKNKFITPIKKALTKPLNVEDKSIKFIDYINKELLKDYNNCSNLKKHKSINIQKLDINKHLREIITIIKFYLSKVNLYIDYGSNITNQEKLLNTLQFTIRKEHNITTKDYIIPTNILFNKKIDNDKIEIYEKQIHYKYHNIMNTIINEEFCNNNKKFVDVRTNKNNPTIIPITIKNQENIYKIHNKIRTYQNKYIETDKTLITPTIKTIYKDIEKEEIIEDAYGNKIIIIPTKNIKRKNVDKKYYDNNNKLNSELYASYNVNTKKDILNHLNSIKPNKLNFANLINQKVRAYNHIKDDNESVNVKSKMNIEAGKVKLNLFTKREANKKRRYTAENYDVNKRDKILNKINIEIKQPVKKLNEDDNIIKIKYDNVISELLYKRTAPILINNRTDYINKFLDNIIEVY
jgi:hypothetical protein